MTRSRHPNIVTASVEEPPILEEWYRRHLNPGVVDISSSGARPFLLSEIRDVCGLRSADLDSVLMDDSTSQGGPDIRQAIADRYAGGRADTVLVTHGSSEAIALTLPVLLQPGQRVVVLEGIYHSLAHYPRETGCEVDVLPLAAVREGRIDPAELDRLITEDTSAVIVNFPHNPTGATLSRSGLDALIEHLDRTGTTLVWDGALAEVAHRFEVLPDPTALYPATVSYGTFSKTFGLPGIRVGWCIAPPELIRATFARRDRTTLFLSPLVELIAAAAMRHADALIGQLAEVARRNLAHLTEWIAADTTGVSWSPPEGGVCGLLQLPMGTDVEQFCRELLQERNTLLVPGTAFGMPQGVRIGFGGTEETFRQGLRDLEAHLRGRGGLR